MTSFPPVTDTFARFVAKTNFSTISDKALAHAKLHIFDTVGVALAAVRTPVAKIAIDYCKETGLRGKFAVNYVVALCVLEGKLEIATFTDARANEPRVQEALRKVRVIVDEIIPEPGTYCPVGIHLQDGTRFTYTTAIAKGHPQNPMSESEVLDKFRSNAKAMLTVPSLEALISTVQRLESLINVR